MAGPHTLEFTDANFESEVLQSDQPVLVDFWAEWCGPCRALGPTIDEIATDYAGKAKIGKLNTDDNQQTASRYNVQSIPTILVLKNGEIVNKFIGVTGKKDLAAAIDSALG